MKHMAYFFLFCGLVSQAVFGESLPRTKPVRVVKYAGFYNPSQLSPTPKTRPQVMVGTFGSVPARVLNSSSRLVAWQPSRQANKASTQMLVGVNTVFSSPAVIVLR